MRILITGGAGFIGSHLAEKLLAEGNKIICVDNFFTGQLENIVHLQNNDNFTLIEHDIIDPLFLKDHLEGDSIDQIYNLACPASPIHYQHNPIRTVKANTIGMINILGLAKDSNARLLQTSTSEVYGDPTVHPQPEEYFGNVNTIGPRSCYDEGKRVAETLCMDYHRQNNVDIRIVRIFNTYGPRMHKDDGRVVSNFILQALADEPITLHGNGSQTRSFCYVDDMVNGLIAMMNQSNDIGPINLGNPEELSMKSLAEKIIEQTSTTSQVIYEPVREDDPKQRRPVITKAQEILDWQPATNLETGLKATIKYFQKLPPTTSH